MKADRPHLRTTALLATLPRGLRLRLRPAPQHARHAIDDDPEGSIRLDEETREQEKRAHLDALTVARLQRLLLLPVASLWYVAFVLIQRRNYQDSWILEDILWPTLALGLLFLYVAIRENDNRIVTLLSSSMTALLAIIPALKYAQPYAMTIDSSIHFLMVESLQETGRVAANHTYESIAAFHTWLAALGLASGLVPTQVIKYGPALSGALMPLIVYWITRRAGAPPRLAKYSILAAAVTGYPYFLPNGTGFALVPLLFTLAMVALWDAGDTPGALRTALMPLVLLSIVQLTLWHSTTPLQLPLFLGAASLTPAVVDLVGRRRLRATLSRSTLVLAVVALLVFVDYHIIEQDRVQEVLRGEFLALTLADDEEPRETALGNAFEIPLGDVARTALIIQGREAVFVLLALAGVGAAVLRRRQLDRALHYYAFFGLVFGVGCALVVLSFPVGIPYSRFFLLPVAVSPLFVGLFFWWWQQPHTLPLVERGVLAGPRLRRLRMVGRATVTVALMVAVVTLWGLDYFIYQPLVPRANALESDAGDDYIVWLHQVNSAYQSRMLFFAEEHAGQKSRFAIDLNGQRQFRRYFGVPGLWRRGLYVPLHRKEPLDPDKVDLFLLHWPGEAGGMAEQLEYRSTDLLTRLRQTPGWNLVYDNGGSFILTVGEDEQPPLLAGER